MKPRCDLLEFWEVIYEKRHMKGEFKLIFAEKKVAEQALSVLKDDRMVIAIRLQQVKKGV